MFVHCLSFKTTRKAFKQNFVRYVRSLASTKLPPGKFIDLGSHKIHYEQIGHGKQHLFLLPGLLGSTRTDWNSQLETLDRDKFTLLAWDPPGYGFSSPPDHSLYVDGFHRDAAVAGKLLKALGIRKTSVMGWCGGGVEAIITAHQNQDIVDKLVLVATFVKFDNEQLSMWEEFKDINSWSPTFRDPSVDFYGAEFLQSHWSTWLAMFRKMEKINDGHLCLKELEELNCPTLLVHSPTDKWVPIERGRKLAAMIKNSRIVEFEGGNHYPHMAKVEKFNELIESFLCK